MSDEEQITYEARAQALVEAVIDYEECHPEGAPCFSEALAFMKAVCAP